MPLPVALPAHDPWTDEQIVGRVVAGEVPLFELLMRRHNERLYRAVRSILRDESECEDAMQAAYLHAFARLEGFEARSSFATWLTRIAVHESLAMRRRTLRMVPEDGEAMSKREGRVRSPEEGALDLERRRLLQGAVDALPEHYRSVFVLRDVQELSIEETSLSLGVREETVKTRLFRARALLRRALTDQLHPSLPGLLPFEATRCDRVVRAVLGRLASR